MSEKYFLVQLPGCVFLQNFPLVGFPGSLVFTSSLSEAVAFIDYDEAYAVARYFSDYNLYVFRGTFPDEL